MQEANKNTQIIVYIHAYTKPIMRKKISMIKIEQKKKMIHKMIYIYRFLRDTIQLHFF